MSKPRLPDPLVTATIERGAVSNRVKRVRVTSAGVAYKRTAVSRATRQSADAIAAQRAAGEHSRARRSADERVELATPGMPAGWHQICVCVPAEVLDAIDAAIERCDQAGAGRPSRSRLIRIALGRLDLDTVIVELRRTR